jgi:hypothetical protein
LEAAVELKTLRSAGARERMAGPAMTEASAIEGPVVRKAVQKKE